MAQTRTEQATFGWDSQAKAGERERNKVTRPRAAPNASEPQLPPDNELWDVHAAARFLKRSVSWVYHRAEDGTLPVTRLGGWGLRFIPGDLRAWVASGAPRRK